MITAHDGTDWRARGACISADPDLFFPVSTAGLSRRQEARAKAVCARCPVRPDCLQFALDSAQPYGVWGGLGELELARVRRSRQRAARRRPAA